MKWLAHVLDRHGRASTRGVLSYERVLAATTRGPLRALDVARNGSRDQTSGHRFDKS